MEQVLVSGSAGFIGGYVVEELLNHGYAVMDLDNFSKYWKVKKSYETIRVTGSLRATPGHALLLCWLVIGF